MLFLYFPLLQYSGASAPLHSSAFTRTFPPSGQNKFTPKGVQSAPVKKLLAQGPCSWSGLGAGFAPLVQSCVGLHHLWG